MRRSCVDRRCAVAVPNPQTEHQEIVDEQRHDPRVPHAGLHDGVRARVPEDARTPECGRVRRAPAAASALRSAPSRHRLRPRNDLGRARRGGGPRRDARHRHGGVADRDGSGSRRGRRPRERGIPGRKRDGTPLRRRLVRRGALPRAAHPCTRYAGRSHGGETRAEAGGPDVRPRAAQGVSAAPDSWSPKSASGKRGKRS